MRNTALFFNNLPKTPHVGVYVFFSFLSILINLNKMNYGHVIKYKMLYRYPPVEKT